MLLPSIAALGWGGGDPITINCRLDYPWMVFGGTLEDFRMTDWTPGPDMGEAACRPMTEEELAAQRKSWAREMGDADTATTAPPPAARPKVVQVVERMGEIIHLLSDGSIWLRDNYNGRWSEQDLPPPCRKGGSDGQ